MTDSPTDADREFDPTTGNATAPPAEEIGEEPDVERRSDDVPAIDQQDPARTQEQAQREASRGDGPLEEEQADSQL